MQDEGRPIVTPSRPWARPATDFKALHRKLEHALASIARTDNVTETLELILEALLAGFRDELGFEGGRIYRREGDAYVTCCGFGANKDAPSGFEVPADYPPHRRVLDEGLVIIRPGEKGLDHTIPLAIGVSPTFAAIVVGRDKRYVIAFSIRGDVHEEPLLYSLTAVRHVINLKLDQQEFTGMLKEARAIQDGMLPGSRPALPGYDIAGRSRPSAIVGGDLYDFLPLSASSLGIVVADASGHGVPAALIARDAVTGLRTLADDRSDVAATVARLNSVIHRQALSSKFISLFYGRFSTEGDLEYCNAGHNAPLLLRGGDCEELAPGGPVLGPIPSAPYTAATRRLTTGDSFVAFTDGIVEHGDRLGMPFGVARLRTVLADAGAASAETIAAAVFEAVDAHAPAEAQQDDMTIVVVRKT